MNMPGLLVIPKPAHHIQSPFLNGTKMAKNFSVVPIGRGRVLMMDDKVTSSLIAI